MQSFFLFSCFFFWCSVGQFVTINTPSGPVMGNKGPHSLSFLGIPFAQPPVGKLRFQPPLPVEPWSKTLNATVFGPGCPQTCELPPLVCPSYQSEDCLQLNIYVPSAPPPPSSKGYPVAVFLPGGNFRQGAASTQIYDGRLWVNASSFILVTTNYRLGALGFLVQDNVPLNLGIKDQRVALQWIADNIASFGGDTSQITLFGQSAGATSIGYHLLSAKSEGLFTRVASQSNPFTLPLKNPRDGTRFGDVFMKHLSCPRGNLACLQNASVSSIVAAQDATNKHFSVLSPFLLFYPWTPVVDVEDGVSRQPIALLSQGQGRPCQGIFGTVANESLIFIYLAFGQHGMSEAEYIAFIVDAFPLHVASILSRYPPHMGGNASIAASYLATDYLFTCPTRLVARARSKMQKNAPTFVYKFQHPISFGSKVWGENATMCFHETCHAGELVYQFNPVRDLGGSIHMTPDEVTLTDAMQKWWANFFWTGDPSKGPHTPQVPWTAYNEQQDNDLRILAPTSHMETGLKKEQCNFWDTIGYDRGEELINSMSKVIAKRRQRNN